MGLPTKELAATYLPFFYEYLGFRGIDDRYEVQVKEMADHASLRFELHERFPPRWVDTIEFSDRALSSFLTSNRTAREMIASGLEASL